MSRKPKDKMMTRLALNIGHFLYPFKGSVSELKSLEKLLRGKLHKNFFLSEALSIEAVDTSTKPKSKNKKRRKNDKQTDYP